MERGAVMKLKQTIEDSVIRSVEDGSVYGGTGTWIFDFRFIHLRPERLTLITDLLWNEIKDYDNLQIGGIESASIPLVTSLVLRAHAEGKNVNGFYIRKSRKKSGLLKQIEGELTDDPIILVDDLMNSSGSFQRQVEVIESVGKSVSMVLTIVRFRDRAKYTYLTDRGIVIKNLFTLHDFDLVLDEQKHPLQNPYKRKCLFAQKTATYQIVAPRSTPVLDRDSVYFGTDIGKFYALDKTDGSIRWELCMGHHAQRKSIFSAPACFDETVYFGSYDGKLYAAHAKSGEIKWVFDECEWVGSSPAISPDLGLVFVGLEHGLTGRQGSVIALDARSGERRWEYTSAALTHASPLYMPEHREVCIGGNEGVLRMFDATSGALKWQFETEGGRSYLGKAGFSNGDIKLAPDYDRETDNIACTSMDGWMYVLDRATGVLRYRVHTDYVNTSVRAGIYGSPVFASQYLLFGALDKSVYCVNKHTGSTMWTYQTAGRIFATPRVVGERVFIGSNDGRLYEFELHSGEQLSITQFSERIVNPVVYDREEMTLYVLTHANELYRLALP